MTSQFFKIMVHSCFATILHIIRYTLAAYLPVGHNIIIMLQFVNSVPNAIKVSSEKMGFVKQ